MDRGHRVAAAVAAGAATVAYLTLIVCAATGRWSWAALAADLPDLVPVLLGLALTRRVPTSPVGAALAWCGTAVLLVRATEPLGLPSEITWPWQFLGLAVLLAVFPDGLLPGRWPRVALVAGPLGSVAVGLALRDGAPGSLAESVMLAAGAAGVLGAVVGGVASLAVRHHRGPAQVRRQLHWLLSAAVSIPVLLVAGWAAELLGAPVPLAYAGVLLAVLVLVPIAVAIAIVREDLFDVDRLFSRSVTTLFTGVVAAAVFAGSATGLTAVLASDLTSWRPAATPVAAFATALLLLPLHQRVHRFVSRLTDRERFATLEQVERFVDSVRAGTADPARVGDVLREALGAPGLTVGDDGRVGGAAASARERALTADAVAAAALPLRIATLQRHLSSSLEEVRDSRHRLVAAVAAERRRLERDLHDGAQQHVVAVGMRLRSLQGRTSDPAVVAELDLAVDALAATVTELRHLAQGVRPGMLDDGLPAALGHLVRLSPLPLELTVSGRGAPERDELRETTAYFVVTEALTNAWKHSRASRVVVDVELGEGTTVVDVRDDGVGVGSGRLTALRDRVSSLGGDLEVTSPQTGGTHVRAVF